MDSLRRKGYIRAQIIQTNRIMKIAIIGAGNIGGAIARGLAQGTIFQPSEIICTAQSEETLEKMRKINPEFILTHDNVEAAKQAAL